MKITIYATVNQGRLTDLGVPADASAVATFVKEYLLSTLPFGAVDRDNLTVQVEATDAPGNHGDPEVTAEEDAENRRILADRQSARVAFKEANVVEGSDN